MIAILCGHEFNPDDFPNYPDDYAGYCPYCVSRMKSNEDECLDGDEEPDGTGLMEFDGTSFAEDDEDGNDESPLDDYEEDDEVAEEDPLAEETEEDEDVSIKKSADELKQELNSFEERRPDSFRFY